VPPTSQGSGVAAGSAVVAAAAFLTVTVVNQFPHPSFGRMRSGDLLSLIPNWRFFAPTPAMHDYHVFFRTVDQEGAPSAWEPMHVITPRSMWQFAWFPARRREKALFDLAGELIPKLSTAPLEAIPLMPAFALLVHRLRQAVSDPETGRPDSSGFQFCLARHSGYDMGTKPEILFASSFVPLDERSVTDAAEAAAPVRSEVPRVPR
jgi:hypothetical protein